ncbi:MAG: hypothetical protein Q8P99_00900 [bacterium]|nr:hypothetical protein [bacterium]MDZ4231461.1 hypothetical protein [Patescibacteria group bacterium]
MVQKKNTTLAVLAYLIFFVPLLTSSKGDSFVRFHVRQGLGLLITFFAFRFLTLFLLAPLISPLGSLYLGILYLTNIILVVLFALGVWNATQGEEKPLPFIGPLADKYLKL